MGKQPSTAEKEIIELARKLIEKWAARTHPSTSEMLTHAHPNFTGFGTGKYEIWDSFVTYKQSEMASLEQLSDPVLFKYHWTRASVFGDTGITMTQIDLTFQIEGKQYDVKNVRWSIIFKKIDHSWLQIHTHCSLPYSDDVIPVEELKARNKELERLVTTRTNALVKEKERTENLLHNILPVEVAKELLQTGTVKPSRFEEVSILFTDFKEFTNIVATIPTRKLIRELNELFSEFDDIMEAEGIEKIQTVGDAYLAASGLPEEVPDHAMRCVRASKKMIAFLKQRNKTSAIKWKIRIGIHSGPIVAGVVGKKKFAYDIFGDTINIASRIETAGEEGRINVSAYTYDLIKEHYPCEYRGKINAKGKGDLDMYFVK